MKHWYAKPHEQLTEYVRTVLIIEGDVLFDSAHLPIFTSGMSTLFFKSNKSKEGYEHIQRLSLCGKSQDDMGELNEETTVVVYFFMPFTLPALFNMAANTLAQHPVDLSNWNPHKYTALKTQLTYALDTARKIEVFDHLLLEQIKENKEVCKIIHYATDQIINHSGKEIIAEILETLDLNERTFQRLFKKYVGITATQYRRICQFQQSFGQLRTKQFDKLSEVAYENGFADQSHFIRTFKEFTQITPHVYLNKGLKNKNE